MADVDCTGEDGRVLRTIATWTPDDIARLNYCGSIWLVVGESRADNGGTVRGGIGSRAPASAACQDDDDIGGECTTRPGGTGR